MARLHPFIRFCPLPYLRISPDSGIIPGMDTPAPHHDQLSAQSVTEKPARSIVQRTIIVRLNLRVLAALGAGLIVLGAFLPWIAAGAQAVLGASRVTPVIQGWPSLLIGLIALGVLALPQSDSSRWVSLPAAALGLAAAFIAVVSALTAANAVAEIVARFPRTDAASITVVGSGVIFTVAGGILCVVAGLAHPPSAELEARLDLRPGQSGFVIFISALVVVALAAGLIGASIGSGDSGGDQDAAFPPDLLATPVIDAQVTPLGATAEPPPDLSEPTPPPPATEPPIPTPPVPTPTASLTPTATEEPKETSTPTATLGSSPLDTPES